MIADMQSNEKLNPVITEHVIRARELNISFILIPQSYFKAVNDVRANLTWSTNYSKIPNKKKIQQISINHFSEIFFKD